MKLSWFALATGLLVASLAGCAAKAGSGEAQVREQLKSIGDAYHSCVANLGEESQACQSLANGISQVASQLDSAQSTASVMRQMEAGRAMMR